MFEQTFTYLSSGKTFEKDELTNHSPRQTTDTDHNAVEQLSGFILSQTNVKGVQ